MRKLLRLLLALVNLSVIAFTILWFARSAAVFANECASVPHDEYSRFADIE